MYFVLNTTSANKQDWFQVLKADGYDEVDDALDAIAAFRQDYELKDEYSIATRGFGEPFRVMIEDAA